ncbi:MAG TPA: long-chain fatty acid--CoA ligase, partial [Chitinophagaceae bacterium]|nr:long-chain fatty acid--CoA ligase [Chitinophagaceae bacterium]
PIENKLKENRFIEQVIIVGAEKKFVGALIVPSFSALSEWMKNNNINVSSNNEAIVNPAVLNLYKEIVEEYNQYFNHVEQVKKFELLPNEWSIDTGEMTPKMSLKRKIILEKYKSSIDRIYN